MQESFIYINTIINPIRNIESEIMTEHTCSLI